MADTLQAPSLPTTRIVNGPGGPYRYGKQISKSATATVWRGINGRGRPVAIKELICDKNATREALRYEAYLLDELSRQSPGRIVKLLSGREPLINDQGRSVIVMEQLQYDLDTYRRNRPLGPVAVREIGRQVALTLQVIHRLSYTHNDIKPGNLGLRAHDHDRVVLFDFGSATRIGRRPTTSTAEFSPPEWLSTTEGAEYSDIFSLGITLYLLVTGHHPFIRPPPESPITRSDTSRLDPRLQIVFGQYEPLSPDIPTELRRAIEFSLIKDPTERIPDTETFLVVLTGALN